MIKAKTIYTFGFLLLTSVFAGCGGSTDVPPLGTVTGTLLVDGQPAPGVTVKFSPKGEGRTSSAVTDADGRYELLYSLSEYGAKVGAHQVTILVGAMSLEEEEALAESGKEVDGLSKRVDKLLDVVKDVDVTEGANEIDLSFP